MNRLRTLTMAAAALTIACSAFGQVENYKDIKMPALRSVNIPQPKRIQLDNGMVIFLQRDTELPLIRGSATIRGGEREVPADKTGLVSVLSQAWRTGGTESKTGDQLDQFLESRAAIVETGGDDDSTSISMNILKGDLDVVYPIWVELLSKPSFRQEKIELAKTQLNTAISRRNDDPGSILSREVAKLGYGADSPYARHPEYTTVASVTREDLLAFHKRFVHPNNMILGFVGDFDLAQMERLLRQTFEKWPRGPEAPKPVTSGNPARPGVYFVSKDDVTQSNIAMVHAGTTRNNPDYYAIAVMNEVLSGGFSGRLMQRLRSERGLTYGAGGGLGAGWDHPTLFSVSLATKSGTTLEAIDALRKEVAGLATSPVTPQELSLAKESILNAYVFQMDSRAKALNQQVLLEFYGFPSDYFEKYPKEIEKVTAADVERVGKKYVRANQLAVLVVGKQSEFERPLATLGEVTAIDVTIPELGAGPKATPPATGTSTAEGVALAKKVRDFVGGKVRIDSVRALRLTGTRSLQTPQGSLDAQVVTTLRYPDSIRQEMTLPMGVITTVITPSAAFVITPVGTQDLPPSQRDAAASQMRGDLITVLKNIENPDYVFSKGPNEKVGDVTATALEVAGEGSRAIWLVEPGTGRLLRKKVTTSGPMGGNMVTDYLEWKSFGGLNLPVSDTTTRSGEAAGNGKTSNVEVNPTVEEAVFVKPAA